MADGAPRPGTVFTVSHWPSTPTPGRLVGDLSVELAFSLLGSRRRRAVPALVGVVTADHFDEDGLATVFALTRPEQAFAHERALVEFARAGDFGVVSSLQAASAVFAVRRLADGDRAGVPGTGAGPTAERYRALLPRLAEVLEHPEHFRRLVGEDVALLAASQRRLARGGVTISGVPGAGLAVVEETRPDPSAPPFSHSSGAPLPLHPFTIHSATAAARVLVVTGASYLYYDRYETWVRRSSAPLPLRRDLVPLAGRLSELEPRGVRWRAEGPGSLVPSLTHDGESGLARDVVVAELTAYLRSAPPAFDPSSAAPLRGGRPRPLRRRS